MKKSKSIGAIAARARAGLPLRGSDELFGALIENAFEIIIIVNLDGIVCYANPSTERVLGYRPAELIGVNLIALIHPDDGATVIRFIEGSKSAAERDAQPLLVEARIRKKKGAWSVLESTFKVLDTATVTGIVINCRDITARKQEELLHIGQNRVLEMIASDAPLTDVLETLVHVIDSQSDEMSCAVLLLDEDGLHMQRGAGPGRTECEEDDIDDMAIQYRWRIIVTDLRQDPLSGGYLELAARHGFNAYCTTPIYSSQGQVLGTFAVYFRDARSPSAVELGLADIAVRLAGIAIEHKQSKDKIDHMAYHDALTGLPNRGLLQDRLTQAIIHADRIKAGVALLYIDLDRFKHINDSLGHEVGDRLLQAVALRLQNCMRKDDSLARLGGDEFVLTLMAPADSHSAAQVAEKALDALHRPIMVDGHELHVSCSIGISLYPNDGHDAAALMRNADAAMYHAKEKGRANYQYFTVALNAMAQYRHSIASQLRQALAHDEFSLNYQCQVDMESGSIFAMEALIRWRQPERGLVSPLDFISIAEDTGLIVPIGEWVLREGCTQLKRWLDAGHENLSISINLSVRQFLQDDIVDVVERILGETGLPPTALTLEITESILMQPVDANLETLRRLRSMGIQLSLDDFGTGYSSLSYLQRFSLNTLKIDQSFVRGIGHDRNDMAITNAIIAMARTLDLKVIAEGVETDEQASFLRAHGCAAAQGYFYSKPVTADVMTRLLQRQTA